MDERLLSKRLSLRVSLVPGPQYEDDDVDVQHSVDLRHFAQYPAAEVIETIQTIPSITVRRRPRQHLERCRWEYRSGDGVIAIRFSLMGDESVWGGCFLECDCPVRDLVRLWNQLRVRHAATWLHADTCTMYTPRAFENLLESLAEDVIKSIP